MQAGAGSVYVPEVYPPSNTAYGNYSRPSYSIPITKPVASKAAQVLSVAGSGTTLQVLSSASPSAPVTSTPPAPTTESSTGILGVLTNNTLVTIVTLVGGILIILAYLFGSDAVRVNES